MAGARPGIYISTKHIPPTTYLFKDYASEGNGDAVLVKGGSNNP